MINKMHIICSDDDLRPALTYVYYSGKGEFIATNANCVGIAKCGIDLGDNPLLIHKSHFKKLTKKKCKTFELDEEEKTITSRDENGVILDIVPFVYEGENDLKFPDCFAVFPTTPPVALEKISFNAFLLKDLSDALGINNSLISFKGASKGIRVEALDSENTNYGLIMPCFLS